MPSINDPESESWVDRYNTPLSSSEEMAFNRFIADQRKWEGRDYSRDMQNYDMRGWWKKHRGQQVHSGHFEDDFKKPNHPTFSTQSMYHGRDGYEGGTWLRRTDKSWTFSPGKTNLDYWGPEALTDYFGRVEPGNMLILPQQPVQ